MAMRIQLVFYGSTDILKVSYCFHRDVFTCIAALQ